MRFNCYPRRRIRSKTQKLDHAPEVRDFKERLHVSLREHGEMRPTEGSPYGDIAIAGLSDDLNHYSHVSMMAVWLGAPAYLRSSVSKGIPSDSDNAT